MTASVKPPCIIGKFCEEHQFVHGAEAEALRAKPRGWTSEERVKVRRRTNPKSKAKKR